METGRMETGNLVRFALQRHPFLVESAPCLDLDCPCSTATLTLTELAPPDTSASDHLVFTLRICLKTWTECDPPPRSLEVESLAREFLARFPAGRIRELGDEFQRVRAMQRRLNSFVLSGPRDELASYSSVIDERGGVREGFCDHSFFFVFEGREFLVEDHYCANPACDCRQVHLEFWERVHELFPKHRITIRQSVMAIFTLAGKLQETRYREESATTAKRLLQAWQRRGGIAFPECARRYAQIKVIGARSFPAEPQPAARAAQVQPIQAEEGAELTARTDTSQTVRRNAPCPCGSGLKFKRCCGRRSLTAN